MATRGIISFVFDDGYELVWQNAVPLFRQHRLPAVFAIPLDGKKLEKTEQRAVRPWQQWLPLKEEGFEIASHSVTHPNLKKVSDEQLDYELVESVKALGATTLIYPGGAVDDRVAQAAARHYTAGRTVHYGFEKKRPNNPMMLKSYNFSRNNFSVMKANALALWAFMTDTWLIETYHMVDDHDADMVHTVKTRDLARHLAFVARLPVEVKTIQAVTTGN